MDTVETDSIPSDSDMPELDLYNDFVSDKTADSGPLLLSQNSFKKLITVKGRNHADASRHSSYAKDLEDMVHF